VEVTGAVEAAYDASVDPPRPGGFAAPREWHRPVHRIATPKGECVAVRRKEADGARRVLSSALPHPRVDPFGKTMRWGRELPLCPPIH